MTESRTFYIVATIRLSNGSVLDHHETHETGVYCPEERATLIGYSDAFAFRQAEVAAESMNGEVLEVDFGYWTPPAIDFGALDLY